MAISCMCIYLFYERKYTHSTSLFSNIEKGNPSEHISLDFLFDFNKLETKYEQKYLKYVFNVLTTTARCAEWFDYEIGYLTQRL